MKWPLDGDLTVGIIGLVVFTFCMFGGHFWLQDLWFAIRDQVRGRGKRDMPRSRHDKTRLVAEVNNNGKPMTIDHSTDPRGYDADLDRLYEIYGKTNVREIKQMKGD